MKGNLRILGIFVLMLIVMPYGVVAELGNVILDCPLEVRFTEANLEAGKTDIRITNNQGVKMGFQLKTSECSEGIGGDNTMFTVNSGESVIKTLSLTGSSINGETNEGYCIVELKDVSTFSEETKNCRINVFVESLDNENEVDFSRDNDVAYGVVENNSFISSLSTNHLLVGLGILLIILIILVWGLKRK